MFAGIITHRADVIKILGTDYGKRLTVRIKENLTKKDQKNSRNQVVPIIDIGGSVAINGVCLTLVARTGDLFSFDVVKETISKTNLDLLKVGDSVNIEFPLSPSTPIGGHFVQGHIDCVGKIVEKRRIGKSEIIWFKIPEEFCQLMVEKGPVAIDGISLTLVDVKKDRISCAIIPFTIGHTTLAEKREGDSVNIEIDILCKYVKKFLGGIDTQGCRYQVALGKLGHAGLECAPRMSKSELIKKGFLEGLY